MDKYEKFKEYVKNCADKFLEIDKSEVIRIISHHDSDGICACSILVNALNRENRKYSISIVPVLNEDFLREISVEDYKTYIFSDIGSGQTSLIERYLDNRQVFILDHHDLGDDHLEYETKKNIIHINPHIFGIGGSKEICGAGISYLFCNEINIDNSDMTHLAIIGAIGDTQDDKGFLKLNNEILEIAKKKKLIKEVDSIRFFGYQSRPIQKMLEYTMDPYIPGISGSESAAIKFIREQGINHRRKNGYTKMSDLTDAEIRKLTKAIIDKRCNEESPEDIFGTRYLLLNEDKDSLFYDAKEFSTILNACGRLNKGSIGIGVCLGKKIMKKKALIILNEYKKEIINAIKWINENKSNVDYIIETDNYMIINAKDNIMPTIIGVIGSIISKSSSFKVDNKIIITLARDDNDYTKISFRSSRLKNDINLREVLKNIIEISGGESGGHMDAAGAIIKTSSEKKFIKETITKLNKICIEETVN